MIMKWLVVSLVLLMGDDDFKKREAAHETLALMCWQWDLRKEILEEIRGQEIEIRRRAEVIILGYETLREEPPEFKWFVGGSTWAVEFPDEDTRWIAWSHELVSCFGTSSTYMICTDKRQQINAAADYLSLMFQKGKTRKEILALIEKARENRDGPNSHQMDGY